MSDKSSEPLGACPSFVAAMEIVGRRWNGLILQALHEGCTSFSEVSRYAAGLSDAMLSRRLRELESDELITRTVIDARPPSVQYQLTEAGASLAPILDQLTSWGERFATGGEVALDASDLGALTEEIR